MASQQPGLNRFYLLLGGLALAGVALLAFLATRSRSVSIPVDVTVLPADTAGFRGYLIGSADAVVEVTEYADYQCPACQAFAMIQWPDIKARLIDTGRLRWRYRDFPLDQIHPYARLSAHSAACGDEQGKFLDQSDRIYAGLNEWANGGAQAAFRRYAEAGGLDMAQYDACMQEARYAGRIQASLEEGIRIGVNSTPSFLVNGRLYAGGLNFERLRQLVDSLAPLPATP